MIELAVSSNFSFLRGASHPEELVEQAIALHHEGIGITDENSLAGVVRGFAIAKTQQSSFRYLIGCRLVFTDGTPDMIVYPRDRKAYGQLCRLLSEGKIRSAVKGQCHLTINDFLFRAKGFQIIVMPQDHDFGDALKKVCLAAPNHVWLALSMTFTGKDKRRAYQLSALAKSYKIPLIATSDILYHIPQRRALQDVLTCIKHHTTIDKAGMILEKNSERHLKSLDDYQHLYRHFPQAIAEQARFIKDIHFTLDELAYTYPDEPVPSGKTPQQHLEDLTWQGAKLHFGNIIPDKIKDLVRKELALIKKLNYAPYFLTVNDIVSFAHHQKILCQGRGSAANSAVCYCLGITNVNPTEIDVLFERFISEERKEPPDIDVDFEHERREEVMQYIYRRYGRERAAIVATVIRYRARSALRDVGKALGLSEDMTSAIASTVWGISGKEVSRQQIQEAGLDPDNKMIIMTLALAREVLGFPRHLSQHVGGFVLTRDRLDETVPIGPAAMDNRTFIEWDKDDIDVVKLMKVDVLSLGMLTCIRKCFDLLKQHKNISHTLYNLPRNDAEVYTMLSHGDSLGVFQVESRAQMNMLPRLKPKEFYDLVIEVAIVRPGPIQGDMVHPYLRRRNYEEEVTYPSPSPKYGPPDELKRILQKTMGVPLFQEQAMRIAIEAAKFSAQEVNALRRAMATFRRSGTIHTLKTKMVEGMVQRGYERSFAENCYKQIEGFGEYGFPESHAASFAHLVYVSSWLKCHHPEVFATGLLNSQPMGFYAPAQILRDARQHNVTIKPIDLNYSHFDHRLEALGQNKLAVRLGFRQIKGFLKTWALAIIDEHNNGLYHSIEDLHRRVRLPRRAFQLLADADCFRSLKLPRRDALWAVRRLPDDDPLPLFAAAQQSEMAEEPPVLLPIMQLGEHVIADYEMTHLSLKAHPMALLREKLTKRYIISCQGAMELASRSSATLAGIVIVRQRPGTAKGVVFLTLEDETGIANVVIWPKVMAQYRREVMNAKLITIQGYIQRDASGVTHIIAEDITDISSELLTLTNRPERYNHSAHQPMAHHPRQIRILPKSRDFH